MAAFVFPNGFQVIPAFVCDVFEKKAQACDGLGNIHWVDNPLLNTASDALLWDTSGFITIANLLSNAVFRVPLYTVATLPAAGNKGRLVFTTDDNNFRVDNGTSWTILAASGLGDPVTPLHGGTGLDTSASSGVPSINAGTWIINNILGVAGKYLKTAAGNTLVAQAVPIPIADGGTALTTLGAANTLLGVNVGATALEYKTLTSTGASIVITNAAGNINLETAAVGGGGFTLGLFHVLQQDIFVG